MANTPGQGPQNSSQLLQDSIDQLAINQQLYELNQKMNSSFTGYLKTKRDVTELDRQNAENQVEINRLQAAGSSAELDALERIHKRNLEKARLLQEQLKSVSMMGLAYKGMEASAQRIFSGSLMSAVNYLMDADKAFKSLNLEIGLSGDRSKMLMGNLNGAATYAARLGVTYGDLAKIQSTFTDEMGRSVLLSSENLQNIVDIGKGTKMGTEQAAKMAAKFSMIGKSVSETRKFYDDSIKAATRYGVSADKIVRSINDNLDKSQGYIFKDGIEGLRKMSMFETKFKMDMNSVFAAIDKTRTLEGAVDTVAQLQVLGGKFAQQDPFKLLHEARTDTEAFTKTIQSLTRGMYTFDKSKGVFTTTAGNLDRLKLAAQATGMSYEDLIKQAQQGAQLESITSQLAGKNISKEAKEFIQGVAAIQKDGSFKIELPGGQLTDIRNASEGQIKALMASNASLNDRAKQAQAFDEVFRNIILELKTSLLPLLKIVNKLTGFVADNRGLALAVGTLGAGALAISAVIGTVRPWIPLFKALTASRALGGAGAAGTNTVTGALTSPGANNSTNGNTLAQQSKGLGTAAKNMLSFGAAVVMVGGGIWLATKGISTLATSLKGLNSEQLVGLNTSLAILAISLGGIAAAGAFLAPAVGPLLAFGGAVVLIGAGVGIAAAGIGYMAKGFGEMFGSLSKVTDPRLIAGLGTLMFSMTGLAGTALLFANPLTWIGLKTLGGTIANISDSVRNANFDSLHIASTSFKEISKAIDSINDKKLDKLIHVSESLSGLNSISAAVAALNNIFGDAIEVKFKDQEVQLKVDITNTIDGDQLGRKISHIIPTAIQRSKSGSVR